MPPTKRALFLLDHLVEDSELLFPKYVLEDAGVEVVVAAKEKKPYETKRGAEASPDIALHDALGQRWDAVHVPGGYAPDKLRMHAEVLDLVRRQDAEGKPLAAICHAGWVLASAGVARGRTLTSYWSIKDDLVHAGATWVDEPCVVDRNLVTARHPPDLPAYARALLQQLGLGERVPAAPARGR